MKNINLRTFVPFLILSLVSSLVFTNTSMAVTPGPGAEQERFEQEIKARRLENRLETAVEKTEVEVTPVSAEEEGGAEALSFQVDRIEVTGNTIVSDADIRKIVAPHEGKKLTLSEVKVVAAEITRTYQGRGYFTCRAYIPPQKVETGTVEIQILEGKLGKVDVQGNKFFKKENISRFLKPRAGKVLQYDNLREDVTKANLHPDRQVKAVVVPGQEVGTSDLILDVKDQFPFHIGMDVNNFGTKSTGEERYGVSARHGNLLGLDDILGARFQWGDEVVAFGTQYVIPVGDYDTQIGASYSYTDVGVGGDFSILDIGGIAHTYGVFVNQPFFDSRYADLTATGGFESKSIDNEILGQPSSNDELRMFHAGINIDEIDPWGRTFVVNDLTFGVDAFGASEKNDPRLSRPGSGASFFKFNIAANRIHPVYDSTMLYLKATGQATNDPLVSAEQYDVGGVYSVRGYPQSDYLGDSGAGGSIELRVPWYFIPREVKAPWSDQPLWNRVNFTAFLDGAHAELKHPGAGEFKSRDYAGVGGGIRFDLPRNLTGRFEWAKPIGDDPLDGSDSQFYFSISGDFL